MQIAVTIDDALYEKALALAEPGMKQSDIFQESMKTFVSVKSAKRLAALGGTMPDMQDIPRQRDEDVAP